MEQLCSPSLICDGAIIRLNCTQSQECSLRSRHTREEEDTRNIAEEYINYVTVNAVPNAITLKQIAYATETDPTLQQVQRCLGGSEWPDTPELNPYKRVKDKLCMSNGLVLRGSRIVMPRIL